MFCCHRLSVFYFILTCAFQIGYLSSVVLPKVTRKAIAYSSSRMIQPPSGNEGSSNDLVSGNSFTLQGAISNTNIVNASADRSEVLNPVAHDENQVEVTIDPNGNIEELLGMASSSTKTRVEVGLKVIPGVNFNSGRRKRSLLERLLTLTSTNLTTSNALTEMQFNATNRPLKSVTDNESLNSRPGRKALGDNDSTSVLSNDTILETFGENDLNRNLTKRGFPVASRETVAEVDDELEEASTEGSQSTRSGRPRVLWIPYVIYGTYGLTLLTVFLTMVWKIVRMGETYYSAWWLDVVDYDSDCD